MGLLPSTAAPSARHAASTVRGRRPAVERIACWSARYRKTAVAAWLAVMAAAFIGGQFVSGPTVQQYDPGQAGRGEQILTQLGVVTPPAESVLIQARAGEQRLEHTTATEVRRVAHDVAAALEA